MPNTKTTNTEVYKLLKDGTVEKIVNTFEIEEPTQEEVIADKEAQLLQMYQELEALKNNQ